MLEERSMVGVSPDPICPSTLLKCGICFVPRVGVARGKWAKAGMRKTEGHHATSPEKGGPIRRESVTVSRELLLLLLLLRLTDSGSGSRRARLICARALGWESQGVGYEGAPQKRMSLYTFFQARCSLPAKAVADSIRG